MNRTPRIKKPSLIAPLCVALASLAGAMHAHAEAPMHTDDAGTLTQGSMKLEGVFSRDDKARGAELIVGAGIAPQLEMEVSLAHAKDTAMNPSTTLRGLGWGVKWVPIQNETGWSVGARFDMGHTRVRDHVTPQRLTEREYALTGLASYRLANDQVLHLNAGHKTLSSEGVRHRAATWASVMKSRSPNSCNSLPRSTASNVRALTKPWVCATPSPTASRYPPPWVGAMAAPSARWVWPGSSRDPVTNHRAMCICSLGPFAAFPLLAIATALAARSTSQAMQICSAHWST